MPGSKKEKIKKAAHILAGFIILLHAYHRFEERHSNYILFLFAGLIFLSIAIFHHRLEHRFPWIDSFFYSIEALLSFIIAYEYFQDGKKGLHFAYAFAGLMQLFTIFMLRRKLLKKS